MQIVYAALLLQCSSVDVQIGFAQETETHFNVRWIGTTQITDLPGEWSAYGV